jgi:hypothetical protein
MKQSCEVASSAPEGSIFFFASLHWAVIRGVPHFWVYGSAGVPAVPATISMSVCAVDSIGDVSKNLKKFRVIKIICSWVPTYPEPP